MQPMQPKEIIGYLTHCNSECNSVCDSATGNHHLWSH